MITNIFDVILERENEENENENEKFRKGINKQTNQCGICESRQTARKQNRNHKHFICSTS